MKSLELMERRIASLKPLLERGYVAHIQLHSDDADVSLITGGDCNCSHRKHYDPKDGHGYTQIHMDDVPDDVLDEIDEGSDDYSQGLLEWMVGEINRVEATSHHTT